MRCGGGGGGGGGPLNGDTLVISSNCEDFILKVFNYRLIFHIKAIDSAAFCLII